MPLKKATEEELQQVDEEGRPYKIFLGQKVVLRRGDADPDVERKRAVRDFGLYSPPRSQGDTHYELDNHFLSQSVVALNEANFDHYIKSKEKALIYFYDTNAPYQHVLSENEFSLASDNSTHYNYGFGGIDCFRDRQLCDRENIDPVPMFKLYSNGFDLSSIQSHKRFNADQLRMLMKMTPILFQPRLDIGRDLLAKAAAKSKKATRAKPCV